MEKIRKYLKFIFLFFIVIFFILSIVDTVEKRYDTDFNQENILTHVEKLSENGPRSVLHKDANDKAVKYIAGVLEDYGLVNADDSSKPSYLIQNYTSYDERYQEYNLDNVIAYIPSNSINPSNEVIMFMAHLDSVPMGNGSSDDGVACSVMLEAIRYYLDQMQNGYEMQNDLLFCFVNGEEFGLYGSKAFMSDFNGFNNVTDRIKFGTNLESRGTSGTVIMFETGKNNYKTIKLFSKLNKNIFSCSIATLVYDTMPNSTDFTSFKDYYQGINMANISNGENYHTQDDNLANLGMSYLSQQADIVDNLIDGLANYDLDELYTADESAIFYTYLNVTTIIYNHTASIIFGILVILMLLANILVSIFVNKENKLKKTVLGLVTSHIALIISAVVTLACYYIFQLTGALFGSINIHILGQVTYSNIAIILGIALLSVIIVGTVSHYGKKFFHITNRDLVRSQAYIHAFLGVVLTFVIPDASYLFMFSGALLLIYELAISMFKKYMLEEYHFELLIIAIYLPVIIPVISLAIVALGLTMSYVYGLLFALTLFNVGIFLSDYLPYISFRRIKTKNTTNIEGALHLAIIPLLIFLIVSVINPSPRANLIGKQNISTLPYDDALILVKNHDEFEYRVYDMNAYIAIKEYCPDMIYDDTYYKKDASADFSVNEILTTHQENTINVIKTAESSYVYLTFTNYSDGAYFTIETNGNVQKFTLSEDYNQILIHSNSIVTYYGESCDVEYKEVLVDYTNISEGNSLIEQGLHFNLWLLDNFKLNNK